MKIKIPNPSQKPPAYSKAQIIGQGFFLQLQNQERQAIIKKILYQGPVTISKSRLKSQIQARNLQHPPKSQIGT